tara:strand:- start:16257 stop:16481 length:225 start_codon:yes stop_codon:yes gene_type:complete
MKVKRRDTQEGFRPITLEITFETVSELKTLWNQLNVTDEEVSAASRSRSRPMEVVEVSGGIDLFSAVDEELRNL